MISSGVEWFGSDTRFKLVSCRSRLVAVRFSSLPGRHWSGFMDEASEEELPDQQGEGGTFRAEVAAGDRKGIGQNLPCSLSSRLNSHGAATTGHSVRCARSRAATVRGTTLRFTWSTPRFTNAGRKPARNDSRSAGSAHSQTEHFVFRGGDHAIRLARQEILRPMFVKKTADPCEP